MAYGLKESKVAIFDIIYHIWDKVSGTASFEDESQVAFDYILGIGVEELAKVAHDSTRVDQVEDDVEVWLEYYQNGIDGEPEWIFNKTLKDGVFSDPVKSITDSDADDIHLYAKWVRGMYQVYNSLTPTFDTQTADDTEVYSWSSGQPLVEMN